jgi:hypothetical protein
MIALILFGKSLFYELVEMIFGITHWNKVKEGPTKEKELKKRADADVPREIDHNKEWLNVYGKWIDLSKHTFFQKSALILITASVISASLILFFDGVILIIVFMNAGDECPYDNTMDCFSRENHTYIYCHPGQQLDPALGSATCYNWIKSGISTSAVLNQSGQCGGLIAVLSWFSKIFLRTFAHLYRRKKNSSPDSSFWKKYEHPCLILFSLVCYFLLIPAGTVIAGIVLGVKHISVTGLTYMVLIVGFVIGTSTIIWVSHQVDSILQSRRSNLYNIPDTTVPENGDAISNRSGGGDEKEKKMSGF